MILIKTTGKKTSKAALMGTRLALIIDLLWSSFSMIQSSSFSNLVGNLLMTLSNADDEGRCSRDPSKDCFMMTLHNFIFRDQSFPCMTSSMASLHPYVIKLRRALGLGWIKNPLMSIIDSGREDDCFFINSTKKLDASGSSRYSLKLYTSLLQNRAKTTGYFLLSLSPWEMRAFMNNSLLWWGTKVAKNSSKKLAKEPMLGRDARMYGESVEHCLQEFKEAIEEVLVKRHDECLKNVIPLDIVLKKFGIEALDDVTDEFDILVNKNHRK